jgi:hypothetical protein
VVEEAGVEVSGEDEILAESYLFYRHNGQFSLLLSFASATRLSFPVAYHTSHSSNK